MKKKEEEEKKEAKEAAEGVGNRKGNSNGCEFCGEVRETSYTHEGVRM